MGLFLLVIALVLPLAAGVFWWPWWTIPVSASLALIGFLAANYGRIEILDGRGGIPRAIASALALNSIACAALFGVGHLLSHL